MCTGGRPTSTSSTPTSTSTLPFVESSVTPTVMTLHGRLDTAAVQRVVPMYPGVPFVSISDHQRQAVDGLPVDWVATVPNGLELSAYHQQRRGSGRYLAFVGRITEEKRPDLAIEVARRTGWPLRIAAKVDPVDVDYYHREIEPLFDSDDVDFVGELAEDAKPSFYADAAAMLFPSDWPEPFGLVMIESLAAGTPVIALRRGAVPEILEHGISGFICDDVDEMSAAVDRLGEIDPAACRRRAEQFGVQQMCARYERVYDAVRERSVARAASAHAAIARRDVRGTAARGTAVQSAAAAHGSSGDLGLDGDRGPGRSERDDVAVDAHARRPPATMTRPATPRGLPTRMWYVDPRKRRVAVNPSQSAGRHGSRRSPSWSGRMPRIHWVIGHEVPRRRAGEP